MTAANANVTQQFLMCNAAFVTMLLLVPIYVPSQTGGSCLMHITREKRITWELYATAPKC